MKRLFYIFLMLMFTLPAFAGEGLVQSASFLLTSGGTSYWPSSAGVRVLGFEYFGYEMTLTEETGADPGATISLDVSMDGSTWTTYSQTVFYPATAAGSATIAIAAETAVVGSIHPMPCGWIRLKVLETGSDADTTFKCQMFYQ